MRGQPRQMIGKRRAPSRAQARGLMRRKQLIEAGLELLASVPVEELSFRQVCEHAGMPEGSGYHFYANKYDLLTALAGTLSQTFIDSLSNVVSDGPPQSWEELADRVVGASVRELFERYFELPPIRPGHHLFFYFIEITDLMFSLSVLEEGCITPDAIEESKRAGKGYLGVYLPPHLPLKVGAEKGES